MGQHLIREVEQLKKRILELSALVENSVTDAVKSVKTNDAQLAEQIIVGDRIIDQFEVDIEEECLKILALHQPVAIDLRYIVAVLKINNDLERIGDLAANIAHRSKSLSELPTFSFPPRETELSELTRKSHIMLQNSLKSLIDMDVNLARDVIHADTEVNQLNAEMHKLVRDSIAKEPNTTHQLLLMISVSRNLERIADLATNICEDVIYMVEGDIVRHGKKLQ